MKKTTLIITEKKNISKQIAKALAPAGTFGERGHSEAEHCDIISLRTNYEKTKIKQSNGRNIGCKILNKGLKEKDYFYFCGENCKSCEFIAQHLDKLGTHSARSVRKKFKYINENLTSDFRSIILDLISESGGNANLSYFYKEIEEGEYPQKEKIDKSKNPLENVILQACQTLIHEKKIKQNKNGFELTQDGKRYKKYSLKDFAITEDIIYYMFDRDNSQIIIADTYGTPYGFNRKFPGNEDLEQAVTSAKDWADFQRLLRYMPNKQAYDPKDLKSHMARTMLFNSIISKRKAPDGADIYLEKIIAATDFDIAGSYIFNSIIEAANKNVEDKKNSKKSKGLHTIEPDLLYRMPLKSLESENIIAEFNNLQNFDWNNAYAGKARSVFDFIYGSTITGKLNKEARKLQNAKRKKKHELRFSVGRTLFLGLKKVIEEEQQMKYAKDHQYIYLAFKGKLDKEQIEKQLQAGNFASFQANLKKSYISLPR
ncbi:MAG: hypothetical protein U9R34_00930, partial [Nanoarchaeota archaeon]|nr:hypothetical protein [Nanoarchaeota archaeon]